MTKVYVIGSFKDLEASRLAVQKIEQSGFDVLISTPGDPRGIDGCLEKIDDADVVFVESRKIKAGVLIQRCPKTSYFAALPSLSGRGNPHRIYRFL